jgi:predicted MPP superfamily phosphohydrolase
VCKLPARGPALVLCGHTHGGQLVLPFIGPLYVPSRVGRRFAAGLYRVNAGWLYVNRGLGEVFPPVRIGCPPEISLLTLTPAQSSD